jgi:hypothetical protein
VRLRQRQPYTPPLLVMKSVRYRSYSCFGLSTCGMRMAFALLRNHTAAESHAAESARVKGGCSLAELKIGNNADQSREKVQGVQQRLRLCSNCSLEL